MSSFNAISLSGMQAAQTTLNVVAHNVANAQTPGFKPQQVVLSEQPQGGVSARVQSSTIPDASLEANMVAQMQAKNMFLANLAVFKAADETAGALLNTLA